VDQPVTWGAPPPRPSNGLARTGKLILMRVAIAAVVIAVVAVFAVVRGGGSHTGVQAYPTISPPSGAFATSTAHADPNAPFDGTPAATYPEGASGLTMPAATAVTKFTKQQVADALTQVHNALVAARLDSKMLVNRDPGPFLALLSTGERDDRRDDFNSDQFSAYATQVAPGHTLSAVQPRVKGRTTFKASVNSNGVHELQIITNYVWVYAFTKPIGDPGDNLVVIHDDVTWSVPSTSEVAKSDRGLWMDDSESYGSNVDCTLFDKGLIAPGTPEMDFSGGGSTEDPDSMFDPDRSLDISNTC
jgi:hypothetical protein